MAPPTTPRPAVDDSLHPSPEFHYHGDPILEAILKHDTEADQAARRKALKELYDEHARMVHQQRSGTFLGDHTIWCFQDCLPEHTEEPRRTGSS
eukprot:scaffold132_cov170-Amphora_coffeaeformis.AAC.1